MRFFSSSTNGTDPTTIQVKVRWYFCKPGARPLPFEYAMASNNWLKPEEAYGELLGEVYGKDAWNRGDRPANATGRHGWCGTLDQWQNGLRYDPDAPPTPTQPDGLPDCCGCDCCQPILTEDGQELIEEAGDVICLEDDFCDPIVTELEACPILTECGCEICLETPDCEHILDEIGGDILLEDDSGTICLEPVDCEHILDELGGDVLLEDGSGTICLEMQP